MKRNADITIQMYALHRVIKKENTMPIRHIPDSGLLNKTQNQIQYHWDRPVYKFHFLPSYVKQVQSTNY